jgi:hypothetical protein
VSQAGPRTQIYKQKASKKPPESKEIIFKEILEAGDDAHHPRNKAFETLNGKEKLS